MAENRFTVEPGALRQLAGSLATLSDDLAQARTLTQNIDASGFGSSKLTDAVHEFVGHWTWQAEHLGTTLAETGKRLGQAADQYDQVEQSQLQAQGQTGAQEADG